MSNLVVLNTRTEEQSSGLQARLTEAGATVISIPMIKVVKVPSSKQLQYQLAQALKSDWLIFTSIHSVNSFHHFLKKKDFLNGHAQIAAVGKSTKAGLLQMGFSDVICPSEGAGSVALLATLKGQLKPSSSVSVIAGKTTSPIIKQSLDQLGVDVQTVTLYERVLPSVAKQLNQVITEHKPDFCIGTSVGALENMQQLLSNESANWLQYTHCIVSSDRTAQVAKKLGMKNITQAKSALALDLVNAIISAAKS